MDTWEACKCGVLREDRVEVLIGEKKEEDEKR